MKNKNSFNINKQRLPELRVTMIIASQKSPFETLKLIKETLLIKNVHSDCFCEEREETSF